MRVFLRIERLNVVRRGRALLRDISFEIAQGEFAAIVGPNGAGKSTLLGALLGLIRPASGALEFEGQKLEDGGTRERAARVAWLPQRSSETEPLPALEAVVAARFRFEETRHAAERASRAALAEVGASAFEARSLLTLSGGERQRVALAALLAQETPLLLVDEPANHLDPAQQREVYELFGRLWRTGKTILCVTHDVNLLQNLGAPERVRILGLAAGELAFDAKLADAGLPKLLGDLFGLEMQELLHDAGRFIVPRRRA